MQKFISKFKYVPAKLTNDCRLTSFSDALWFNDIEIDEYTLLVLGEGLTFLFSKVALDKAPDLDITSFGCTIPWIDKVLAKNMKLPMKEHFFTKDTFVKNVTEFIDKDIPIVCFLNGSYLQNTFNEPSIYNKDFNITSSSCVVIVGYDLEKKVFLLNYRENNKTISVSATDIENFMNARELKCFPTMPDEQVYELQINNDYKKWLKKTLPNLLNESLKKTCNTMLKDSISILECPKGFLPVEGNYKSSENSIKIINGLEGIKHLIKDLEEFREEIKYTDCDQDTINNLFLFRMLSLRVSFAQGSITASRKEYGTGLKSVGNLIRNKKLISMGSEYFKLGNDWRKMIRNLYHVRKGLNNKDEYLRFIINSFKELENKEEFLITRLQKAL